MTNRFLGAGGGDGGHRHRSAGVLPPTGSGSVPHVQKEQATRADSMKPDALTCLTHPGRQPSSALPSWAVPGFHAPAGTFPVASSSAAVIIHPQVNSAVRRGEDSDSGRSDEIAAGAGPVDADEDLLPEPGRTCRSAAAGTSLLSANVFDPAFPGRSSMARHSRVLASQAPSGWMP
jgi:hypothetical protein